MTLAEFAPITLNNGLEISFIEQDNRYFGDYHRICITAVVSFPKDFHLPAGMTHERAKLEKRLEKMGVPNAALETERNKLVESFLASSRDYLERDDFPRQLLRKLQTEKSTPIFLRNQ